MGVFYNENEKKGIRDGDHDATIVDVTYSSDKNGEDYAWVFFDTDSGEEYSDVIFPNFSKKNAFAAFDSNCFLQTGLTDLFMTNSDADQSLNALLSLPIGPGGGTMNCNLLQAWANIGFG